MVASNYRKLRLVLWKNWLLQWRHKVQTVIELLMPVVSVLILIMMRSLISIRDIDENTMYQPVSIDSLQDLRFVCFCSISKPLAFKFEGFHHTYSVICRLIMSMKTFYKVHDP